MNQGTGLATRDRCARVVKFVARAFIVLAVLLTLVGSNLVFTATATGELCTLACCAGRAPHAAGSCMQGSCAQSTRGSAHHGHDQADETSSEANPAFVAGAHGSDMDDVPTVEASAPVAGNTASPNFSAAALSAPCSPDCGACTSAFELTKRPRNSSADSGSQRQHQPEFVVLSKSRSSIVSSRAGFVQLHSPRGPPLFFS